MKGKSTFTQSEANAIIVLIRQKLKADRDQQKRIRDKIRKIGFYASDFGIGGGYTEHDFLRVVEISNSNLEIKETISHGIGKKDRSIVLSEKKRSARDEAYIIDLCDEVFGIKAHRQYRFDFLRGDSGTSLPVDAYYPSLNLAVEYHEKQHTEVVKFFDRRMTVSGVGRGEQRKKYDQLRRDLLPRNGIILIEFGYNEFEHDSRKRLRRIPEKDTSVIKSKLPRHLNL